jgi:hypothetical protein
MISHDPEQKRFVAIETGWVGGEIEARNVTRAEAEEIMAAIFDAAFPTEPSRFAKRVTGNPDSHAGELQDGA